VCVMSSIAIGTCTTGTSTSISPLYSEYVISTTSTYLRTTILAYQQYGVGVPTVRVQRWKKLLTIAKSSNLSETDTCT
jgi:hypothetical protein